MDCDKYILLDECESTNAALKAIAADSGHGTVVYTHRQTAGRGQRGNSWEAEPGKNVTMSLLLRPDINAREQFRVSEAVALGVAAVVAEELDDAARVKVKWPNDIYVDNMKIAGILIENSLIADRIGYSVAGIGLNVNQTEFLSDAPNPVSLAMITHRRLDVDEMTRRVARRILDYARCDFMRLHELYLGALWRRDGYYPYATPDGAPFEARIVDVAPSGMLSLADRSGQVRSFAFKEVAAIL